MQGVLDAPHSRGMTSGAKYEAFVSEGPNRSEKKEEGPRCRGPSWRRPLWPHSGPPHHRRNQCFNVRRANLLHHSAGFDAEKLQSAVGAGLTEGAEAPDIGPTDANRGRAHAQSLHHVGAAAEAGVDQDRN